MGEFSDKMEELQAGLLGATEKAKAVAEGGEVVEEELEQDDDSKEKHRLSARERRRDVVLRNAVDQLAYEADAVRLENQELANRVHIQEQLLNQKQAELEQQEEQKQSYYENNLQTREAAILNELRDAKEAGEIDREILLQRSLAKLAAEQSTYDLYKHQSPAQSQYSGGDDDFVSYPLHDAYQSQMAYPSEIIANSGNDALEEWLEENSWADPNSEGFSPRLQGEVNAIALELEETLKYNGQSQMIGTPQYYNSLTNIMNGRYGRTDESEEDNYEPSSPVAPIYRSGGSLADRYASKNPNNSRLATQLSKEEYNIARQLRIPNASGGYLSPDDAVRSYAEQKKQRLRG